MSSPISIDILRLPPEQVRLALAYPELPKPIPFATAEPYGPAEKKEVDYQGLYCVGFELAPESWDIFFVPEEHHRIVEEYEAAAERRYEAWDAAAKFRAAARAAAPPGEPEPEAIPPEGKLTGRQEAFCRHYARQPVGTRAAVLAGYSEDNAAPYGSRLLKNPLVLDRIATLRQEQQIHYVVERDTMHDKLEAVFFEALGGRNPAAAVSALRLQAALAGILGRSGPAGLPADGKAKESQGRPAEKPTKAKLRARGKPRKAKAAARKKPRKAKQSQ